LLLSDSNWSGQSLADNSKATKFAPAERADEEEIKRQAEIFERNEALDKFLRKIPAIFFIVNKYRQVVYMNQGALNFTGLESVVSVVGRRPGEIFGCIHAEEEEGGCGTSESCGYCGAIRAVLKSQQGIEAVEDARLTLGPNEDSYDLRVWAAPLNMSGGEFYAVTIQDISDEKRRAALERAFFHDILNTASGLLGTVEILANYTEKVDLEEFLGKLDNLVKKLIEEIQSQRLITQAERKELQINLQSFYTVDLLDETIQLYESLASAKKVGIEIDNSAMNIEIISDRALLRRIIGNSLKNALEATSEGGKITLGCDLIEETVQFWVHNPSLIPREARLQIFQRSFSTKGAGRGLGTYSMKLLSVFLGGKVFFTTSKAEGTTFKMVYPIRLER
jgi:PAS domain-containing protein